MPKAPDGPRESKIPIFLLTGFLGSGKTTLLSQVLRDPRFSDTAVVINEFGEVGLDHFLVSHSREQLIEMTSGCLCCTIRGDIRRTLLDLHARRAAGSIPVFSRLVVETTGLADPAPVIHTFMTDRRLADRFVLSGVVATVDAVNGLETLERQPECVKQIAVADQLVLTKSDVATGPPRAKGLAALRRRLRRLNPAAPVHDRTAAGFDTARLFGTSPYDPGTKPAQVRDWLNEEAYEAGKGVAGHGHHHGHDHHHEVNRHGEDIQAYSLVLEDPVDTMTFSVALELLIANQGADVLRFKGVVHLAEAPGRPVVLHGVQHVFHEPVQLDDWDGDDRRSRLVLITRNMPKETVQAFFDAWQSVSIGDADSLPVMEARA